jgi:hypothetical protein
MVLITWRKLRLRRTRRAPRPGRCSCREHGRYHHWVPVSSCCPLLLLYCFCVPDGEDTAGLGETGLLLDTADPLLEDRGDLSGGGLSIGGIAAREGVDNGCGVARLYGRAGVSALLPEAQLQAGRRVPLSLACPVKLSQRHPNQRRSIPCAPQRVVVAIEMFGLGSGGDRPLGSTGGEA